MYNKWDNNRTRNRIILVSVLICIAAFISIPVFFFGIEGRYGQDLAFHLNRIEGIVTELRAGHFPVKMESFWMDGYGYPVAIYYGDILLYISAVLRLLGVGVVTALKVFILIVNFATVFISYTCFNKIFKSNYISVLCTLIYAASSYRLENLYVRGAVGEYCAMIFIPVIMYGVYRIYDDSPKKNIKGSFVNATILTLGLSGLINTHILSLEMTGIVILLVALILFKKTFTPKVLLIYLFTAVETIVVNLFFIVPFLDYFFTQDTNINRTVDSTKLLQEWGMKWWEIIHFFKYPFANGDGGDARLLVTPGAACIIAILFGIFVITARKASAKTKLVCVLSVIILFVCTCYFPWDYLSENFRVGEILAQIQFPWRFVGIVVALSSLLSGLVLKDISSSKVRKGLYIVFTASCIVTVIWFSCQYYNYGEFKNYETYKDLDSYDMGYIEYLRKDTSRESFTGNIVCEPEREIEPVYRNGVDRFYSVTKSGSNTHITLPIVNYKGYEIIKSDGNLIEISDGENNLISFDLEGDYEGVLFLRFKEPLLWKVAEILSVIGICLIVIVLIYISDGDEPPSEIYAPRARLNIEKENKK